MLKVRGVSATIFVEIQMQNYEKIVKTAIFMKKINC